MGEFLRKYQPPKVSLNATLNHFLSRPSKIAPSALITMEVQFPDVSFWQGEINYDVMAVKTEAIILRIGQNKWIDKQFERNYAESKRKGILVGGYWFYDGRVSPQEQADTLISAMQGKNFELEIYIDWEHNYGGAHEGLRNVVAMMQLVEQAGLKKKGVGLYTGYYFFRANSNPILNASQYNYLKTKNLWEAWYSQNSSAVLIPAPWSYLTIWQWGTPMMDFGQESIEIDMNFYNGTKAEFEHIYGTSTGEPMADYIELKSVWNSSHSIRSQTTYPNPPHIFGAKIGQVDAGKVAKAVPSDFYRYTEDVVISGDLVAKTGDVWWKVYEANGVLSLGWTAEIHKGVRQMEKRLISDTPTPTPTLPTINLEISDSEGKYPTLNIEWKPK